MTALPSGMSVRKYAKLAAFGAVGVAFGAFALYALIAYGARPTPTGGIDRTHTVLTWIAAFIPIAAIAAAHLAYAKILMDESKRAD